jgi:hypothetical protein
MMEGFRSLLDPINALADGSPGFVWRLQTEDGDATAIRAFEDDSLLMNMSVWESIETFAAFVFDSDHAAVMRQRKKWFETLRVYACAWWVPVGIIPTPADAVARLDLLTRLGPTQDAFTIKKPFPPPGQTVLPEVRDDWTCPV